MMSRKAVGKTAVNKSLVVLLSFTAATSDKTTVARDS